MKPCFGGIGWGGMGSGKLVRAREALGAHRASFVHNLWRQARSRAQMGLLLG